MSRVFIIAALLAVLSVCAAGQNEPFEARYSLLNFHSYVLSPYGVDWQSAQALSRTYGGYLASINSVLEQTWINDTFNYGVWTTGFWIGLNDVASEGNFVWDSGEPVTYTNWLPGEPNNYLGDEDYVHTVYTPGNMMWNDNSSPSVVPGGTPPYALIEMADGDRVNFNYSAGPLSCSQILPAASPNYEGVTWNGAGNTAGYKAWISAFTYAGMPASGSAFLALQSSGALSLPAGTPFPRPVPAGVNEVRVEIPPGTKGVSYAWDFLNAEGFASAYKDGMDVAVVDVAGNLIQDLTYADTSYVLDNTVGPGLLCFGAVTGVLAIAPAGPQTTSALLPPLPYPAYLSIVCWNGIDNFFPSVAAVDAIHFWGTSQFKLGMSAPFGAGSIEIRNSQGFSGNSYLTAITLAPGAFPFGWLFGVDIPAVTLLGQIGMGPPVSGSLNASGISSFVIPSGVPPGLTLYAVSLQFNASGPLGGSFVNASTPEFFLTF